MDSWVVYILELPPLPYIAAMCLEPAQAPWLGIPFLP